MSTTDTVLLIIVTALLSIFIIMCIAITIVVLKLISNVKQIVVKAETAIDSVESAADIFKNVGGKVSVLRLMKNIIDMTQHKK
jgi:hypothetical protein